MLGLTDGERLGEIEAEALAERDGEYDGDGDTLGE